MYFGWANSLSCCKWTGHNFKNTFQILLDKQEYSSTFTWYLDLTLKCNVWCSHTQVPNLTLWVSSGQPLHLVSALSDDGSASGDLFWDDGESIDTYENNQYAYIVFNVTQVLTLVCLSFLLTFPRIPFDNLHKLCPNLLDLVVWGYVCRWREKYLSQQCILVYWG